MQTSLAFYVESSKGVILDKEYLGYSLVIFKLVHPATQLKYRGYFLDKRQSWKSKATGNENPKNCIDHGNQQTLTSVIAKMKEELCSKLSD